jgi:hypothetical protein
MQRDNPIGILRRPRARIDRLNIKLQVAFADPGPGKSAAGEDPYCVIDSQALSQLPVTAISTLNLVLSIREDDPDDLN